jgi:hypothetical protein
VIAVVVAASMDDRVIEWTTTNEQIAFDGENSERVAQRSENCDCRREI